MLSRHPPVSRYIKAPVSPGMQINWRGLSAVDKSPHNFAFYSAVTSITSRLLVILFVILTKIGSQPITYFINQPVTYCQLNLGENSPLSSKKNALLLTTPCLEGIVSLANTELSTPTTIATPNVLHPTNAQCPCCSYQRGKARGDMEKRPHKLSICQVRIVLPPVTMTTGVRRLQGR